MRMPGTLLAMGFGRRPIVGHYLGYGALAGLVGGLPGAVGGLFLAGVVTRGYRLDDDNDLDDVDDEDDDFEDEDDESDDDEEDDGDEPEPWQVARG